MTDGSDTAFIGLEDIWQFMHEEGVGVGHVAMMKERAATHASEGHIPVSEVPYVIGDAELEGEFMRRISSGKYVRVAQVGVCGPA